MLGAQLEGVGLAQVPEPIAAEHVVAGKLVRVLEPFALTAPGAREADAEGGRPS